MRSAAQKRLQFTKQLKVMLGSGVPLVDALDLLSTDEDEGWAEVVRSLLDDVTHGHTLSNALRKFPKCFPSYFIGSVASAEMSGQISSTLGFLEDWLEREQDLKSKVKKALTYPCLVLGLSLVMVLILFNTVIPKLMDSFSSDLYEPALPTKILTLLTAVMSGPLVYLLAIVTLLLGFQLYRNDEFRTRATIFFYSLPVLGDVLANVAALRYISSFVLLLESGGQLLPTLRAAARSSGSPLLLADEARVTKGVSQGEALSTLWSERPHLYPQVVIQMAILGENASSLSEALRSSIPYLEMETHSRLERFVEYIEPILISGVALFIGFVAIAVIMPISQITANF